MTPNYLNSPPPPPFPLQLNEDQHHQLLFSPKPQPSSSSSSSLTCPIFFSPTKEQGGCHYRDLHQAQPQQEAHDKFVFRGGSYDHPTLESESDNGLKLTIWKTEDRNENHSENGSVKWMSSKMRVMQKMMISDQTGAQKPSNTALNFGDHKQQSLPSETDNNSINSSNINSNNTIRVCADCNTTKTPLWRSGPRGPKSLCNACGIRQRKARRAMAAAAATANGTILPTNTAPTKTKAKHKDKKSSNGHVSHYKKRCKLAAAPSCETKKLCFEDFTISLSKNSAFHRVFLQDEIKEAAILLMALSCGLVHG
ncbi:putative GATA transcription factor 22 [Vitis vinifera]|uniref:Putative GATA transcription factor 22 n=1 Tax=Vitis vinifera TaxID=29760 RepID=A0A438J997_VITVI|nr:putative GATA transcription factor 22 [Vitis vinifera]